MSVSNVSTYGQTQTVLHNTKTAQLNTDEAMGRIGTGKTSDRYSGAALDAKAVVSDEIKESWADHTVKILQNRDIKGQKKETAIQSIIAAATRMKSLTTGSNNGSKNGDMSYQRIADSELQEIMAHLNVKDIDGNYLFAGDKTNTAPVDFTGVSMPTVTSGADTSYYRGNDKAPVTAKDAGFEKILRAVRMATATVGGDKDKLGKIGDLLTEGISEVSSGPLASVLNERGALERQTSSTIEDKDNAHYQAELKKSANVFAEMVNVRQEQLKLQASFITSAKQNELLQSFMSQIR